MDQILETITPQTVAPMNDESALAITQQQSAIHLFSFDSIFLLFGAVLLVHIYVLLSNSKIIYRYLLSNRPQTPINQTPTSVVEQPQPPTKVQQLTPINESPSPISPQTSPEPHYYTLHTIDKIYSFDYIYWAQLYNNFAFQPSVIIPLHILSSFSRGITTIESFLNQKTYELGYRWVRGIDLIDYNVPQIANSAISFPSHVHVKELPVAPVHHHSSRYQHYHQHHKDDNVNPSRNSINISNNNEIAPLITTTTTHTNTHTTSAEAKTNVVTKPWQVNPIEADANGNDNNQDETHRNQFIHMKNNHLNNINNNNNNNVNDNDGDNTMTSENPFESIQFNNTTIITYIAIACVSLLAIYFFRSIVICLIMLLFLIYGIISLQKMLFIGCVELLTQPITLKVMPNRTLTQIASSSSLQQQQSPLTDQEEQYLPPIQTPPPPYRPFFQQIRDIFSNIYTSIIVILRRLYTSYIISTKTPFVRNQSSHLPTLQNSTFQFVSQSRQLSHQIKTQILEMFFNTSHLFTIFSRHYYLLNFFSLAPTEQLSPISTPNTEQQFQQQQEQQQQYHQQYQQPKNPFPLHDTTKIYNLLDVFCLSLAIFISLSWFILLITGLIYHLDSNLLNFDLMYHQVASKVKSPSNYHHLISQILIKPFIAPHHQYTFAVLQCIMAGAIVANTARSMFKLPSLQTGILFLAGLMLYDIFWVYISPYIFGTSVMIDVATGQAHNEILLNKMINVSSLPSQGYKLSSAMKSSQFKTIPLYLLNSLPPNVHIDNFNAYIGLKNANQSSFWAYFSLPTLRSICHSFPIPMLLHFPRVSFLTIIASIIDFLTIFTIKPILGSTFFSIIPPLKYIHRKFFRHFINDKIHPESILGLGDILIPAIFLSYIYVLSLKTEQKYSDEVVASSSSTTSPSSTNTSTNTTATTTSTTTNQYHNTNQNVLIDTYQTSTRNNVHETITITTDTNPTNSTTSNPPYPSHHHLGHHFTPRSLANDLTNIGECYQPVPNLLNRDDNNYRNHLAHCQCHYRTIIFSTLSSLFPSVKAFQATCDVHKIEPDTQLNHPYVISYYSIGLLSYLLALFLCQMTAHITSHGQPALLFIVPIMIGSIVYTAHHRNQLQWVLGQ